MTLKQVLTKLLEEYAIAVAKFSLARLRRVPIATPAAPLPKPPNEIIVFYNDAYWSARRINCSGPGADNTHKCKARVSVRKRIKAARVYPVFAISAINVPRYPFAI